MPDSQPDRVFRALIVYIASFAYAMGFYISTKKFLDFSPTDPVAVGRVTVEAASKLQDYVRFGYFVVLVPFLTLLLAHWLPRLEKRITSPASATEPPLPVFGLAALPLVLSPFLYLTTYKELWSVPFPPLLSWMALASWVLIERFDWIRAILRAGERGTHALIVAEGMALLLFRYIATGRRIAHIPSLLLETIVVAVLLVVWWSAFVAASHLGSRNRSDDAELLGTWRRLAAGASPLCLLPLAAILPLKPFPAFLVAVIVAATGIALFTSLKIDPPAQAVVDVIVAWFAVPVVVFVLSYASSAHTSGWVDLFHQGESLGPASDYLRGKVPYTQIFPLHGLLHDGLLDAWLMEWFGRSLNVAVLRSTLLEALMLPSLWILAWAVFRSWIAAGASVLGAIVLAADNQRGVLEILVVLLIVTAIRSGRKWAIFAAGALSTVTFFFSLEIGVYCLVGAGLSFAALVALEPGRETLRSALRSLATLASGAIVGAIPFVWFLIHSGAFGAFLRTTFGTIPGLIDAIWSLPFPDLDDWFSKSFPEESLFQLAWHVRFGINTLVIGLAVIVLAKRALAKAITIDDRILATLTAFALVTQRSALGRADFYHQWFSAFLISPILVALVWRAIRLDREQSRTIKTATLMTTIGLIPVLLTVLWAPPLLEKRLDETVEFRARRSGQAPDPSGAMSTLRIDRVASAIQRLSAENDPLFDFSNQPAFYFFADRRNPTRFYQVPLMSPIGFQREVVDDLERDPPAVILMSSPDGFDRFDSITNRDRALLVSSWIEHHYSPVESVEGVDLWVPASEEPSRWIPPDPIPGPRDVALRPRVDGRIVFPSIGTITGADGARWSSDLHLHNPHDVPVGFRLRFVTRGAIREHRYSVQPGESAKLTAIAESFFGMPQQLGALWIIYDQTFPPAARIVTRRRPGSARGIHTDPLGRSDAADGDRSRSRLLISGFEAEAGERINLSIVNFGHGPAEATVRLIDARGDATGQPYTTRIEEEQSYVIVDLLDKLTTDVPEAGAVEIDIAKGLVAAQLSIVDSATGSADVIKAVPISDDD